MRLEAHRVGLPVKPATFTGHAAIEKVAGIDLQARLIGVQLHYPAGFGVGEPRGEAEFVA